MNGRSVPTKVNIFVNGIEKRSIWHLELRKTDPMSQFGEGFKLGKTRHFRNASHLATEIAPRLWLSGPGLVCGDVLSIVQDLYGCIVHCALTSLYGEEVLSHNLDITNEQEL